ncbi:MAG TPA: glycoside hydrolase family 172 protein [Chloroflexota bacterium]|nr:glycoside hydrolase family 172 protein [Chloroflexota bacterium]
MTYNGLGLSLGNLPRLSNAQTRSISAENVRGEKGRAGMATEGTGAEAGRDLGQGWKLSPSVRIAPGETFTLADVAGSGAVQQIWITTHYLNWRRLVLRFFWDGDERPAVEVPLGDFFCNGWCQFSQVSALPVAVNPNGGMNCFWEMPFRRRARITIENAARPGNFPIGDLPRPTAPSEEATVYYQINYTLTDVPDDLAYFHAQWRRSNPLPYRQVHTLLDGVSGSGHYVGTYVAWGVNNSGWWGEGEIKFYLDGDRDWPTICGTGTEDYFGGAWNFDVPGQGYTSFSTPFLGLSQIIRPDGLYRSQQRFGMYRFHVMDPIRFQADIRATIQALGWRAGRRYLPLQDDIASTVFWYQRETSSPRPALPDADGLEVV